MASLYIYYRVAAPQHAAAEAATRRLLTLQAAQTGIAGRLLRRIDDATTWMEVYEGIDDLEAFSHALAQNTAACGLLAVLGEAQRVIERFEELKAQDKALRMA